MAAHGTSIRIPRFAGSGPQRIGSALLTTRGPIFAFRSGQGFDPHILRLLSRHFFSRFNKSVQPLGRQEGCESVEIAGGSLARMLSRVKTQQKERG